MQFGAAGVELVQDGFDSLRDGCVVCAVTSDKIFHDRAERLRRQVGVGDEHGAFHKG